MGRESDLFSFCVGGLALVSTVVSVAIFLRGYLPSAQIKVLDEVFDETKTIFENAIADGLLSDEMFRTTVRCKLDGLHESRECLRRATFQATTCLDEIKAFWGGMSNKIIIVVNDLKKLRRLIATTSEAERVERLRRRSRSSTLPSERFPNEIILDVAAAETLSTTALSRLTPVDPEISIPDLDFFSLVDGAAHDSTNRCVCLLGINSNPPEQDLRSGNETELSINQELPGPSIMPYRRPGWFIRCLHFCAAFWTGMSVQKDQNEPSRKFGQDQPPLTSDSDVSSNSLTLMNGPARSFSQPFVYWRCGGLPKSHSMPDLGLETRRSDWGFPSSWPSTRGWDGQPPGSLDVTSLPV